MNKFARSLIIVFCYLLLTSNLILPAFLSAQIPEWVYQYVHPSSSDEWSSAIVVDSLGNTYTTGVLSSDDTTGGHISGISVIKLNTSGQQKWIYFNDTLARHAYGNDIAFKFNKVYVTGYAQFLNNNKDLIVLCLDTSGVTDWIHRDTVAGEANAVIAVSPNTVYIAGFTYGSSLDIIAKKLDSLGNEVWRYVYDGPAGNYDEANCLAIDKNENIHIGGYSTGISTAEDFTVIKLDSAGNEQWVYRYDGPANYRDELKALTLDPLGNIYMTGWSWGIVGEWDFCVVKIDSSGQEQWVYRYDAPSNMWDLVYDLAVDDSGNAYVCGCSDDVDTTSLFTVIKVDSHGNEQWCYFDAGPNDNGGIAICVVLDGFGGVYAGGFLRNTSYRAQIAVAKLNLFGDTLWTYIYPHVPPSPSGADVTHDIVADIDGNIYVAGRINVSTWNDDIVVMKFASLQGVLEEVKIEKIANNKSASSIFRGGVDIFLDESAQVVIYDVVGRPILQQSLPSKQRINIKLQPGVYFMRVGERGNKVMQKIIIL
ncbi:hypothetical protein A2Y85_01365 [candidate division WOR-3 bacterium RBG_13_43_14]|uniref:Secretion system C-terminal sorting domain-containing protein n=1 Tax=candidate division WOR-3 bacterium RBG_13_43_14 TaxID=1802590 RepID=A0A1F4U6F0_UNCW3|nr:MAG: hypothetical protein A2Y85_01365 [candidate division WOR-3 bacterium RBG_13_43_14]